MYILTSSEGLQWVKEDKVAEGAETGAMFMPFEDVFVSRLLSWQRETTEDESLAVYHRCFWLQ